VEQVTPHLERRTYLRMSLGLPLEYRLMNIPYAHGAPKFNWSRSLLIHDTYEEER
jgi:hypothetical protein